jgi:competence protein ComEC
MLRLLLPFAAGILSAEYIPYCEVFKNYTAWVIVFLLLGVALFLKQFRYRLLSGCIVTFSLFVLGGVQLARGDTVLGLRSVNWKGKVAWLGEVTHLQSTEKRRVKVLVAIDRLFQQEKEVMVRGKIQMEVPAELSLAPGDVIVAQGELFPFSSPVFPAQFNYREFMNRKGVWFQTKVENVKILTQRFSLQRIALRLRRTCIENYREMGFRGDELAVLTALSLGDKTLLDKKLNASYSGAGATHVLAVSGLHIGIVFLLFTHLFKWLGLQRLSKGINALLLLLTIWSFALLTGLSPSVQRAGLMFSFVIAGNALKRNSNTLNSIAASAVLLLFIHPGNVYDVGFQLSYAAVTGIVLLHPVLYPIIRFNNWLIDKVWSISLVAVTAQLATFPIVLYYFHQFPIWFLLSNLLVVPAAFVIVATSLLMNLSYWCFSLDFFLSNFLNNTLYCLNYFVTLINELPFATIEQVWIEFLTLIYLYLAIILVVLFLLFYRKYHLFTALLFLLLAIVNEFDKKYAQLRRQFVSVYPGNGQVIAAVNGLDAELVVMQPNRFGSYERQMVVNHLRSIGIEDVTALNSASKKSSFSQLVGTDTIHNGYIVRVLDTQIGVVKDKYYKEYLCCENLLDIVLYRNQIIYPVKGGSVCRAEKRHYLEVPLKSPKMVPERQ